MTPGSTPPLAPASISVAIVGHRPARIANASAVASRISEVLQAIGSALSEVGTEHSAPRVLSALAEGADRLGAHAALALNMPLDVVLPFRSDEYERDFLDSASVADYRTLLGQADTLISLDSDGSGTARERAYDAVGMVLIDNADLLLAVWDGEPGRGRGGTREVIAEAARRGMPFVVIAHDGSEVTIRGRGTEAAPMRIEDVPKRPIAELASVIRAIAGVPATSAAERLQAIGAMPPSRPLASSVYPLLLKLAGVEPWRKPPAADRATMSADPLDEAFRWWDAAAIQAALAFRSAVILNFALSALAVLLAAASVFSGSWKWLFVLAEVITILLLLYNTIQGRKRNWQERWLESRQIAELLRQCIILRSVGIGREMGAADAKNWVGWYVGSLVRGARPRSVDFSDIENVATPVVEEVAAQAAYNARTAGRMSLAGHRIERVGEVLFGVVLAAAVSWLGLKLFAPELARQLQNPLIAITGGLPAIATASYGIRIIIDFEGIAERSRRIASGLDGLLEGWKTGPHGTRPLQDFVRRSAEIMLADVSAWRLLAEGRRLTIPG